MSKFDIEAYARTDVSAVISVLSAALGPIASTDSLGEGVQFFEFEAAPVVVWESEDHFLSVSVGGAAPWTSCVALGRFLAERLPCAVRCDPTAEFPEVSPYSNVFLEIEGGRERLVAWG
ncbi:hypothetical protein ACQ86G_18315 [Roseateles chitinivorans]|uniref:hypothetical protein n=1 Tax=Roseateles chitinivorans TaxID=2917965 RepID=UPI003D670609